MFQNFELLSLFVFKRNVGYQGLNSQNACQNSKQGRPDKKQSDLGLGFLSRPLL